MSRSIDRALLEEAGKHYAAFFLLPDTMGSQGRWTQGPSYVMQDFFNFHYKDEFDLVIEVMKDELGKSAIDRFIKMAEENFSSRTEKVMKKELTDRLGVDLDGGHANGKIGKVIVGSRDVGQHIVEVEANWSIARRRALGLPKTPENRSLVKMVAPLRWNVYAGEEEERQRDSGVADPIPMGATLLAFMEDTGGALNTRISLLAAQTGANPLVDILDGGSAGATIQGRDGAQPTDPDTAVSGTNAFTLTCSATAFGAATDAAPGALKTANAITDDSSADATVTLGYCRASTSNAADTPLVDHIDGEAGTSGADFNFNTLSIVSGSTVSMTAWTATLPES